MTTEATFQAALDADPTDWQTRLVFSDWLLEQGDMRWPGILWLGMERKWPVNGMYFLGWQWLNFFDGNPLHASIVPPGKGMLSKYNLFNGFNSRAEAEDAFCRAYPALAAAHPAEFAVGVMA